MRTQMINYSAKAQVINYLMTTQQMINYLMTTTTTNDKLFDDEHK